MSTTDAEILAISTQPQATDTDEEWNVVAEPTTKFGKSIFWMCEVKAKGHESHNRSSWWVDYAPNWNILLEAAYQTEQKEVKITWRSDPAGGDWDCNLGTMIQTNSDTKVERRMRRVVVT